METDKIFFSYAIYESELKDSPELRFDHLIDAIHEFDSNENAVFLITEISTPRKEGGLQITEERVVKADMLWIDANRFQPEYQDSFLCDLSIQELCGNVTQKYRVCDWYYGKWANVNENETVKRFMIIKS